MNDRKKENIKKISALLFTGVILLLLFQLVEPATVAQLVRDSDSGLIATAFLCYMLVCLFRSLRFQQFDRLKNIKLSELYSVAGVHGFLNMIMPARSGELSFVYLIRQYHHVDAGKGAGFLLLTRIFDLLALLTCFMVALIQIVVMRSEGSVLLLGLSFFLLIVVFILGIHNLGRIWGLAENIFMRILIRFSFEELSFAKKMFSVSEQIGVTLKGVTPKLSLRLLLTSFAVWLAIFTNFGLLMYAMGFNYLTPAEIVVGSTGGALTSVLPINAVGNWGTLQIGWTATFSLLGMSLEDGVTSGIAVQIWTTLFALVIGGVSYLTAFSPLARRKYNTDDAGSLALQESEEPEID